MANIIEGYNYDIFIICRQKEYKYNSWKTEFVDYLRQELEATYKENHAFFYNNLNDELFISM